MRLPETLKSTAFKRLSTLLASVLIFGLGIGTGHLVTIQKQGSTSTSDSNCSRGTKDDIVVDTTMDVAPTTPVNLCDSNFTIHFSINTKQPGQVLYAATSDSEQKLVSGLVVNVANGGEACGPESVIADKWSGVISMNFANGTKAEDGFCSFSRVTDGNWHEVDIVVQRHQSVVFYLDGVPGVSHMTLLDGPITLPVVQLGKDVQIRDLKIFNRDFSDLEIQAMHEGTRFFF